MDSDPIFFDEGDFVGVPISLNSLTCKLKMRFRRRNSLERGASKIDWESREVLVLLAALLVFLVLGLQQVLGGIKVLRIHHKVRKQVTYSEK